MVGSLTDDLTQDILLEPDLQSCTAPGYKMHGILQGLRLDLTACWLDRPTRQRRLRLVV